MDGLSRSAGMALKKALPFGEAIKERRDGHAVEHHDKATALNH
jgi:hypothetical protein